MSPLVSATFSGSDVCIPAVDAANTGPATLERADERCACSWTACKNTGNIRKEVTLKLRTSSGSAHWLESSVSLADTARGCFVFLYKHGSPDKKAYQLRRCNPQRGGFCLLLCCKSLDGHTLFM